MSRLQTVIPLLCSLLLSACGFTLRGYGEDSSLPEALQVMEFSAAGGNTDLAAELRRQLEAGGATLAADAPYALNLGSERTDERIISLDSTARAGEYALSLIVSFELRQGSRTVLGPEEINLEQSYRADPQNAIAKQEESEIILEEMRRDAARRIMGQLRGFDPAEAARMKTPADSSDGL